MLDYETAAKHVSYDPETGVICRIHARGTFAAGRVIEPKQNGRQYPKTNIAGYQIPLHRLAWLLHHKSLPTSLLDHINGDLQDCRIANLRLATHSQNSQNRKVCVLNTSGVTGVRWLEKYQTWRAMIFANGARHELGSFKNKDDAIAARKLAEAVHFGEFVRERDSA